MTVQRSHGKPRARVLAADELPTGVPEEPTAAPGPIARDKLGRFANSEAAKAAGRLGGTKKSARNPTRVAKELRISDPLRGDKLGDLPVEPVLRRFLAQREAWAVAKAGEIAADVGGGVASAGVTALIRSAAQKLAYSDFFFAAGTPTAVAWDHSQPKAPRPRTDLAATAARLSDSARQDLLGAHELAAREAQARRARPQGAGPSLVELIASGRFALPEGDDDEAEEQDAPAEPAEGDGR